jgi:hypothetical protein
MECDGAAARQKCVSNLYEDVAMTKPAHEIRRRIALATLAVVAIGIVISVDGCQQRSGGSNSPAVTEKLKELNSLQEKRMTYEKQLKGMTVTQLSAEISSDSEKGREQFNSAAYRETVSRGKQAAGEIKAQLKRADRSSLLGLLAVRQLDAEQYRSLAPTFRVSVLIDALKTSKYFNVWGVPGLYWEDAAKAIIDESEAAAPSLVALLRDTRPAPLFGSEGAAINQQYHYRVRDYAWALLNEGRHKKVEIPTDPKDRDRLIDQELKTNARGKP